MGYEVKIYAGYLGGSHKPGEARYMHIVGMVDLCKVQGVSPSKTGEPVYFYCEPNGDEAVKEDLYGDELRAIPVAEMLETVKKASKGEKDYRRWKPAIALLESLLDFPGDEIYCAVYGH